MGLFSFFLFFFFFPFHINYFPFLSVIGRDMVTGIIFLYISSRLLFTCMLFLFFLWAGEIWLGVGCYPTGLRLLESKFYLSNLGILRLFVPS